MSPEASFCNYGALSFDDWESLWLDYVGAHAAALPAGLHRHTFKMASSSQLQGVALRVGAQLCGFAHFYLHPSTYQFEPAATLEDLYVTPSCRGRGLARLLIEEVAVRAKAAGASSLHWKTRVGNLAAQALYERIAQRTDFLSYRMSLV
jgi:ribosomal protein S18 acetylase RimI-like enzyme